METIKYPVKLKNKSQRKLKIICEKWKITESEFFKNVTPELLFEIYIDIKHENLKEEHKR